MRFHGEMSAIYLILLLYARIVFRLISDSIVEESKAGDNLMDVLLYVAVDVYFRHFDFHIVIVSKLF